MSRERRTKGRLPPFIAVIKSTIRTPAWLALSHGAVRVYLLLLEHYNENLQNAVYLSTRDAAKRIGANKDSISRWLRELEFYGFIVMVSPSHLGVEGCGKAAHWRLTEKFYLGRSPTREFLNWAGSKFKDNGPRNTVARKSKTPSPIVGAPCPLKRGHIETETPKTLGQATPIVGTYGLHAPDPSNGDITSLTTPCLTPAPDSLDIPAFFDRRAELSA